MPGVALTRRDLAYASDELRSLRDSLRPASVSGEPYTRPIYTVWSADDRLLCASSNIEERLGWEARWFIGHHSPTIALYRPQDLERVYAHFYHSLMGRVERGVEHRIMHSDGTGYVWLSEDMIPCRWDAHGRVRQVRIRSFDVTALRAREVDFALECLRLFRRPEDAVALEELGIPALLANLLPGEARHAAGKLIPFPFRVEQDPLSPGMRPALSSNMPRRPRRRPRRLPRPGPVLDSRR
jgi:hypothetical protein